MRIIKKFPKSAEFASKVFDGVMKKSHVHLPYSRIEFHVRDRNITLIEDDNAVICIDSNSPFILEKDARALSTALRFELFRLMLRPALPREIEDVIVGREMVLQGFGDDLFYMYYNQMMKSPRDASQMTYIRASVPWITFRGVDNYNSSFLKELLSKLYKKRPGTTKLLNYMCNNKFAEAVQEYNKLFAQ